MKQYYYGYFRSVDTSSDPEGQLFKVQIFTDYDGHDAYIGEAIELQMASHPFSVTYQGEDDNLYKPYKCSTATVRFMQSTFNASFFNGRKKIMVALLRLKDGWRKVGNRISNGSQSYNHLQRFADKECYSREWVGFATPEKYNLSYDSPLEVFELEAQDAFSSLKYKKFNLGYIYNLNTQQTFINHLILRYIGILGVYNDFYVHDSIKSLQLPEKDILKRIGIQKPNLFTEDGEGISILDGISMAMQMLGLTIIPHGDAIYIIDYNGLENHDYYYWYHQVLLDENQWFNPMDEAVVHEGLGRIYMNSTKTVTPDVISQTGTQISTGNFYNKIMLESDNYTLQNLIPDINDNEQVENKYEEKNRLWVFPNTYYGWTHAAYSPATVKQQEKLRPFSGYITTYQYDHDIYDPDNDSFDWSQTLYSSEYGNLALNYDTTTPNWAYRVGCVVLADNGVEQLNNRDDELQEFSVEDRKFYFHLVPICDIAWRETLDNDYDRIDWDLDNKQTHTQTMLVATTRIATAENNTYINITGDWTFFRANYSDTTKINYIQRANIPSTEICEATGEEYTTNSARYIYARVEFHDVISGDIQYLDYDLNTNTYTWVERTTPLITRLPLANSKKPFGEKIPLKTTTKGIDGITVKIPDSPTGASEFFLTIAIDRPLGVSYITSASCAILENFNIQLLTNQYVQNEILKIEQNNNTKYTLNLDNEALEDYDAGKLKANSEKSANIAASTCWEISEVNSNPLAYSTVYPLDIINDGNFTKIEQHIINNVVKQYSSPCISLNINLKDNMELLPHTILTWPTQFPDQTFVIDTISNDYEYNTNEVKMVMLAYGSTENRMATYTTHRDTYRTNKINYANPMMDIIKRKATTHIYDVEVEDIYSDENSVMAENATIPVRAMAFSTLFADGTLQYEVPDEFYSELASQISNNELFIYITEEGETE